jgi:hypothetical protein
MVEEQEPRLASRNRKADIRKMMKLAEGTGKRRLAALIWAGNHDDPLRATEKKLVRHNRGSFPQQF